jgi:hypothetical protein
MFLKESGITFSVRLSSLGPAFKYPTPVKGEMKDPSQKPESDPSPLPQESFEEKSEPILTEPPLNPSGGTALFVDPSNPAHYPKPSLALQDAGPDDQVFIRPGVYEDHIFARDKPIHLLGAGRTHVEIFCRRKGPMYLQHVPRGHISGITFRYVGSDQHSPINILDSICTISQCRATDGILSGIVIYGPNCRPTLRGNEVCYNRESGIFSFAGAHPYISENRCFGNHHFGLAVRDDGTHPDLIRNLCSKNRLSGILLFHSAQALLLDNTSQENDYWGLVLTPDCTTSPEMDQLLQANTLASNPLGAMIVTEEPLKEIGR